MPVPSPLCLCIAISLVLTSVLPCPIYYLSGVQPCRLYFPCLTSVQGIIFGELVYKIIRRVTYSCCPILFLHVPPVDTLRIPLLSPHNTDLLLESSLLEIRKSRTAMMKTLALLTIAVRSDIRQKSGQLTTCPQPISQLRFVSWPCLHGALDRS